MRFVSKLVCMFFAVLLSKGVDAGDFNCFGYTSTTDHFACTTVGNCVWWTAFKRPDLAAKISGSGWNGGQWLEKFKNLGFKTGIQPGVGSVVEFSSPGHEAFVDSVDSDGSFRVSEMDATGSLGSRKGLQHAKYRPYSGNTYTRYDDITGKGTDGGWTLRGFIYGYC